MSHNKTPTRALSNKASHAFPSLVKDAVNNDTNPASTTNQFIPMFDGGVSKGRPTQPSSESRRTVQDDPLESAARRGYELGYAAGRDDACGLVQNDLAPIIDDVENTLTRYANSGKEIAGIYSINCLKLALAIVEKITGEAPLISMEDLSAAQSILNEALLDSFGLNLRFHPDDYQCIETVSACKNNLDWKTSLQLGISPDDSIDPGAVQSIAKTLDWNNTHEQMAIVLDTVMATHGHKPPQE